MNPNSLLNLFLTDQNQHLKIINFQRYFFQINILNTHFFIITGFSQTLTNYLNESNINDDIFLEDKELTTRRIRRQPKQRQS